MDPAPDPRRRRRAGVWAAALCALAFGLLLRAPLAAIPLERDEGEYAYLAWRWLEGETPYLHTVDQKPPGAFAVYAVFLALLGETPVAIHAGFAAWLGAAQLALFAFARRIAGSGVALGAALLFAVVAACPALLGSAAQVEALASVPIVAAAALAHAAARSGSALTAAACGAACGAMLLFKPVTAPIAALSLAWLAFGARRPARARLALVAAAAAGAGAVLGAFVAVFARAGALTALWDAVVRFNLDYATEIALVDYPVAFRDGIAPTLPALGAVYAVVAIAPLVRRAAGVPPALGGASGFAHAWLAAALAAAAAGGYFRQHYFLYAAAPLALLAAAGLADLAASLRAPPSVRRHAPWLGALAAAALAVAVDPTFHLPGDPDAKSRALYGGNPFPESREIAAFVAERSAPADRLFVFGSEPQIQVLARRANVGRYVLAYHYLLGPSAAARARQREVLAALRADPPRFVVTALYRTSLLERDNTPREIHAGLEDLLREAYRPVAQLRLRMEGVARLETRPEALAQWERDPRLLSGDRSGWLVVYERTPAPTRP